MIMHNDYLLQAFRTPPISRDARQLSQAPESNTHLIVSTPSELRQTKTTKSTPNLSVNNQIGKYAALDF